MIARSVIDASLRDEGMSLVRCVDVGSDDGTMRIDSERARRGCAGEYSELKAGR